MRRHGTAQPKAHVCALRVPFARCDSEPWLLAPGDKHTFCLGNDAGFKSFLASHSRQPWHERLSDFNALCYLAKKGGVEVCH